MYIASSDPNFDRQCYLLNFYHLKVASSNSYDRVLHVKVIFKYDLFLSGWYSYFKSEFTFWPVCIERARWSDQHYAFYWLLLIFKYLNPVKLYIKVLKFYAAFISFSFILSQIAAIFDCTLKKVFQMKNDTNYYLVKVNSNFSHISSIGYRARNYIDNVYDS